MTLASPEVSIRFSNDPRLIERLEAAANQIRALSVAAIYRAGSGHPGGSLSCADILAILFEAEMNIWPTRLDDPMRDRFVMSKGHAAPALYATGAHFGFCSAKDVLTLRKLGSPFQGHPHAAGLPWAETSTGSLGQGFSAAIGMAMGQKHLNNLARVYTLLGDGELQEGEVWEGAMSAAHHRLDNLLAIVDYNKLQSDAPNSRIMGIEPVAAKFRAFGWFVQEADGHDFGDLLMALENAFKMTGRPSVVVANTVKGKGVPFMEFAPEWHGSVRLTRRQAGDALAALGRSPAEIAELIDDAL